MYKYHLQFSKKFRSGLREIFADRCELALSEPSTFDAEDRNKRKRDHSTSAFFNNRNCNLYAPLEKNLISQEKWVNICQHWHFPQNVFILVQFSETWSLGGVEIRGQIAENCDEVTIGTQSNYHEILKLYWSGISFFRRDQLLYFPFKSNSACSVLMFPLIRDTFLKKNEKFGRSISRSFLSFSKDRNSTRWVGAKNFVLNWFANQLAVRSFKPL